MHALCFAYSLNTTPKPNRNGHNGIQALMYHLPLDTDMKLHIDMKLLPSTPTVYTYSLYQMLIPDCIWCSNRALLFIYDWPLWHLLVFVMLSVSSC